jgi:hypothetical protein
MVRFPVRKEKLSVFNQCLEAAVSARRALLRLRKLRSAGRGRRGSGRKLRYLQGRKRFGRLLGGSRSRRRGGGLFALGRGGAHHGRGGRGPVAQNAERDAGPEEDGGQNPRRPRHEIRGAAAAHKTAAASADAKRAPFRPLEQDEHDHRNRDRYMYDKKNSGHGLSTGQIGGEATVI